MKMRALAGGGRDEQARIRFWTGAAPSGTGALGMKLDEVAHLLDLKALRQHAKLPEPRRVLAISLLDPAGPFLHFTHAAPVHQVQQFRQVFQRRARILAGMRVPAERAPEAHVDEYGRWVRPVETPTQCRARLARGS